MEYRITIRCDNAAFHDDDSGEPVPGYEVGRILLSWLNPARWGEDYPNPRTGTLMDVNGNTVGKAELIDD